MQAVWRLACKIASEGREWERNANRLLLLKWRNASVTKALLTSVRGQARGLLASLDKINFRSASPLVTKAMLGQQQPNDGPRKVVMILAFVVRSDFQPISYLNVCDPVGVLTHIIYDGVL
jgi:hypothetical protein